MASPAIGATNPPKDKKTTEVSSDLTQDVRDFLYLDESNNSESDDPELPCTGPVLSPAWIMQCTQHASRLEELRVTHQRLLSETRTSYDTHNSSIETNELLTKETDLLNSLYERLEQTRRDTNIFTSVAESDESRFGLEKSLRRAKDGMNLVLAKSLKKRNASDVKLNDANEELRELEISVDELNRSFNETAEELKVKCEELKALRGELTKGEGTNVEGENTSASNPTIDRNRTGMYRSTG